MLPRLLSRARISTRPLRAAWAPQVPLFCRAFHMRGGLFSAVQAQENASPEATFPVVDYQLKFTDPRAFADEITRACHRLGFFVLKNPPIPTHLTRAVFARSHEWFQKPLEEKLEWGVSRSASGYEGYLGVGAEVLDQGSEAPEPREAFNLKRHDTMAEVRGTWPHWFQNDVDVWYDFLNMLHNLLTSLLRSFAVGLGVQGEQGSLLFEHSHSLDKPSMSTLRLLHYPPCLKEAKPVPDLPPDHVMRAGLHSDYGTLTLLIQDGEGGLQVFSPVLDRYLDVPYVPDSVVVNTADLLQHWTGAVLRSAQHRVIANPRQRSASRYSLAYFACPTDNCVISKLDMEQRQPPLLADQQEIDRTNRLAHGLARPFTAQQYLYWRLGSSFSNLEQEAGM